MKLVVAFFALLLWAVPLSAAIWSGEHPGLTRVVATKFGPWSLQTSGRSVELVMPGLETSDLGGFFTRITRNRVESISATERGIRLQLACDCAVSAKEIRGAGDTVLLQLDIADAPEVTPPAPVSAAPARNEDSLLALYWGGALPTPAAKRPSLAPAPAQALPGKRDLRVEALEDTLIAQFSRAASQGMVEPARRMEASAPGAANLGAVAGEAPVGNQPSEADRDGTQMLTQTALDRDMMVTDPSDVLSPSGGRCDVSLQLGPGDSNSPDFATDLSSALSQVVGEFDLASEEAVSGLVKVYLSYGLPEEALAALGSFRQTEEGAEDALEEARSLALILMGLPDPTDRFGRSHGCDSVAALWAVFAAPEAALVDIETGAVARSFGALPGPLRQELHPRLRKILLAKGATALVSEIDLSAARDRSSESSSPPAPKEGPIEALRSAFSEPSETLETDVIDAIAAARADYLEVPLPLAEAVSSVADETAQDSLRDPILRAAVVALYLAKSYDEGDRVAEEARVPKPDPIWGDLLDIAAHQGAHDTWLRLAFEHPEQGCAQIGAASGEAARAILEKSGFKPDALCVPVADQRAKAALNDLAPLSGLPSDASAAGGDTGTHEASLPAQSLAQASQPQPAQTGSTPSTGSEPASPEQGSGQLARTSQTLDTATKVQADIERLLSALPGG